jgi:hypothetical protein
MTLPVNSPLLVIKAEKFAKGEVMKNLCAVLVGLTVATQHFLWESEW